MSRSNGGEGRGGQPQSLCFYHFYHRSATDCNTLLLLLIDFSHRPQPAGLPKNKGIPTAADPSTPSRAAGGGAFATQHKVSAEERAKLEAAVESGSTDGLAPKTLEALESEGGAVNGEPGWGEG